MTRSLLAARFFFNGPAGDPPAGDPPAGGNPPAPRTFTQEEVNAIVAKEKKAQINKVTQLEQSLAKFTGTASERDALKTELEQLQASLRSKEEQAAFEANTAKQKYEEDLKVSRTEAEFWKKEHHNATMNRALLSAASEHGAFNPEQVVALLLPNTVITEEKDADGKKTGRHIPMTTVTVPDAEGKMVKLFLSPSDAVKKMSEAPKVYGNLFTAVIKGGMGSSGNFDNGATAGSAAALATMSMSDYMKQREARKKR